MHRYFSDHTVKSSLAIFLVLACGATSVQAASFDCVAPVFPDHSTSREGVRRIEKQLKQWRACTVAHRSQGDTLEVDRLNVEVETNLGKWMASTRAYSNGQFNGQNALSQIERDKLEYGMWIRGTSPARSAARTGEL